MRKELIILSHGLLVSEERVAIILSRGLLVSEERVNTLSHSLLVSEERVKYIIKLYMFNVDCTCV